jgi:putative transport protein
VATAPLGYAVADPFGVIGILLTMVLIRNVFRVDVPAEADDFAQSRRAAVQAITTMSIEVRAPEIEGKAIHDIPCVRAGGIVVAAIRHAGAVHTAGGTDVLERNDVVLAVGPQAKLEALRDAIGTEAPARMQDEPGVLTVTHIVATRPECLGKRLFDLHFLDAHGVVITRLNRSGVELVPDKSVRLKFGDFLTCVGEADKLKAVAEILGNDSKALQQAQIIPIFLGFLLGALLGSVPLFVPGLPVPIKLGLAGGPVIVAILLARLGNIGPLVWFMPPTTTNTIRDIGITIFMSAVGVYAGPGFLSTVVSSQGLEWLLLAALVTFIPLFSVGLVLRGIFRVNMMNM